MGTAREVVSDLDSRAQPRSAQYGPGARRGRLGGAAPAPARFLRWCLEQQVVVVQATFHGRAPAAWR